MDQGCFMYGQIFVKRIPQFLSVKKNILASDLVKIRVVAGFFYTKFVLNKFALRYLNLIYFCITEIFKTIL